MSASSNPASSTPGPSSRTGGRDPEKLPGVEVIYRRGDDVVALFRRVGNGGLLLISDTRFFSDMNVEDMSGYWLGNLALIHDLFKKYLGRRSGRRQALVSLAGQAAVSEKVAARGSRGQTGSRGAFPGHGQTPG